MADFHISFDHVHIVLVRPPSEIVLDTTIVFTPTSQATKLDFTIEAKAAGEVFDGMMEYSDAALGVVFRGQTKVQSYTEDEDPPSPPDIPIDYVGPGAGVTRIQISPKTMALTSPNSGAFTVQAFDANGAIVANTPIAWSVSDATVAAIANGALTPQGKRGAVTVTARTPTNISDNATATIVLKPAGITVTAGGGQTGKVGTALAQQGFVKVVAADQVGVQGVAVIFAAPAGGKVGTPSALTDANGVAFTTMTLGGTVGPQSFAATAAGFTTSIAATATVGDPASIAAVSGSGQTDTVYKTLKDDLVAKVTDAFGNPVPSVTVTWARTAGSGAPVQPTSTTNADGLTSVKYALGTAPGIESIAATVAGVANPAAFSAQALPGTASDVAMVSGDGQSTRAGQAFGAPLVVRALDAKGNPVVNADVLWTATNVSVAAAKTTTDSKGVASNTFTAGSTTGPATISAMVGGRTIVFSATVQAGVVGKLAFRTQPPNSPAGQSLTPAVQVELDDAFGNPTAAANQVSIALGANPGGGSLGGTLTRTAVNGVATFDDLQLTKAGAGYTLVATSAGATPATSASFSVGAGSAAAILVVAGNAQTATVGTAVPTAPQVKLVDASQNPIAGGLVTFTPAGGSGTAAPSTAISTDAAGLATLTSWTLGTVSGAQSLVVSSPGVPNVTMTATATAGAAAKLGLTTQPSGAAQSGIAFPQQPVIQIQDASGNAVASSGVVVSAAIATGGGTLGGTAAVTTNAAGVATFTNLSISGVVGARTLTFAATSLTAATSNTITVGPGAPSTLAFVQQPSGSTGGVAIAPAITVSVRDASGNTVTTSTNVVTMAIAAGTGTAGATLSGTVAQTPATGVATFANLSIDKAGLAYRLTATSPGLTLATSNPLDIAVGPVASVSIAKGNNQIISVSTNSTYQPLVAAAKDAGGNPVAGASMLFTPSAGATVSGASTLTTDAAGQAGVNLSLSGGGGSFTVSAAVGAASTTFNIQNVALSDGVSECKRATTGAVYCAGINTNGTLGNGGFAGPSATMALVTGGHVFTSFTPSASEHQCGLVGTQAFCWGRNTFGEVGDNSTTDRPQPVAVAGGLAFQSIAVSSGTTCGLTTSSQLYCWGWAAGGLMADGDAGTIRTVPTLINTGGHVFTQVAANMDFACGVDAGAALYCWGATPSGTFLTATAVTSPAPLVSLTAGEHYMCGLSATGAAYCWGLNFFGELGTGSGSSTAGPTAVAGGLSFAQIRALGSHTCGVTTANVGYCWGWNGVGQLGDSTNTNQTAPTAVTGGGLRFLYIDGGNATTTCATSTSLQPYCWGSGHGELGDGTFVPTTGPTPVTSWPGNASATPNRVTPGKPVVSGSSSPP